MKAIVNGRVIVPDENGKFTALLNHAVIFDTHIEKICPTDEAQKVDVLFDAKGNFIAPGFINVHIHGAKGYDTMDDDADALPALQRAQAEMGVTAFLPTTMTYDMPTIYKAIKRIRARMGKSTGAEILGAHLEGPFISHAKKGAQADVHVIPADYNLIAPYADVIKIITLAPEELRGDYTFLRACKEAGIQVSCFPLGIAMRRTRRQWRASLRAFPT